MRATPETITELKLNEIFVFGSNYAGRHGKGAALTALKKFGAVYGNGFGPQGQSYAIPTKGWRLETLRIDTIAENVTSFLYFALRHPELTFLVTEVGCGLAGYKPEQIAPLFANHPPNVVLPERFISVNNRKKVD